MREKANFAHRAQQLLGQLVEFVGRVLQGFARHHGPQNAASLTFATLLSIVPLMAVSLAVFYAFPVADKVQETVQGFLFSNFVPASGEVLQQYLQAFSDQASKLNGVSFAFLVVVALTLMANIDRTLNAIWDVRRKRGPLSKFLIYWSVLTLGPVLMAVSVLATSYLLSFSLLSEAAASGSGQRLLSLTPVLASALAFSLMYAVIPNVRVRVVHALVGGMVAALLFEAAKHGFAYYITSFPTYEAIYGALAAIPIFLVWLYLSWTIVLIGAEVTHCLRSFHWQADNPLGRDLGLADAVQVLLLLDEAAGEGEARPIQMLAAARSDWREDKVEALLEQMLDLHWVHQTRSGRWSLARRLHDLSLREVMRRTGFLLPQPGAAGWPADSQLASRLLRADAALDESLDVPLAAFRLQRAQPQVLREAHAEVEEI